MSRDGPNLEARARDARRSALPAGTLTGHTADDRAATLLINLLRGAGADGLSAMGPSPTRPILALRRVETLAVCSAHGLRPLRDPSNTDPRFVRNRVRDELLPLLDDIAGRDIVPLLLRTATVLADDAALAEAQVDGLDAADASALAAASPAIARRVVRRWLTGVVDGASGYPPDAATVERVLEVARGERRACEITGGHRVERHRRAAAHRRAGGTSVARRDERRIWDLMATRLRGRWALGITPRNFTWILKDKLAICERPGGYGENHRRVRRQEEIIWIRENGFGCVISIIPAPHNLHNYDELGVTSRHRPFNGEELEHWLKGFYRELAELLKANVKVIVHGEEVGDRIVGIIGGYIRWAGLVDDDTQAITVTERLAGRQLDPFAAQRDPACSQASLADAARSLRPSLGAGSVSCPERPGLVAGTRSACRVTSHDGSTTLSGVPRSCSYRRVACVHGGRTAGARQRDGR